MPKKVGRPSKLTPEIIERLHENLSLGMAYKHAAQEAGICYNTFNDWVKKAEAGEQEYLEFLESVHKAVTKGVRTNFQRLNIETDDPDNWRAAKSVLEMHHHK